MLDGETREVKNCLPQLKYWVEQDSSCLPAPKAGKNQHTSLLKPLRYFNFTAYMAKTHTEGNKSGCLLAWLIQQEQRETPILELRYPSEALLHTQCDILSAFHTYYSHMYKMHEDDQGNDISALLDHLTIHTIDMSTQNDLDAVELQRMQKGYQGHG
ncbi:hypothetical protein NDU88_001999 [Pleurodeles waltl]|uniref:Uncharacterized protein n=1 Tax=Pleurodeles waltl TaxID=8319 RepID=A0AAV7SAL5_PLEWA|nr:hypothetical protein NDU88_001999 [Pleurodeles waltl]